MASPSPLLRAAAILFVLVATCSKMDAWCLGKCPQRTVQTQACLAHFVVRAKVLNWDFEGSFFNIRPITVFKADANSTEALKAGRLYLTNENCPSQFLQGREYFYNFKHGIEYLFTGFTVEGRASTDLCASFGEKWNLVKETQREGFSGQYELGCSQCTIVEEAKMTSDDRMNPSICSWDTQDVDRDGLPDCQSEHSACVKELKVSVWFNMTLCSWKQNKIYDECMEGRKMAALRVEEWDRTLKDRLKVFTKATDQESEGSW